MSKMNREIAIPGAEKPELMEMPQIKNRMTFIYLEKCKVSREGSAVKAENADGFVLIPSHSMLTLMLGPGCSLSHRAAELIGDSGMTIIWCGEAGVKFYGFGRPLTNSSTLLIRQAKYASLPKLHIQVVRRMYGLRYPDEDLTGLTLQQLRGKEGARMRKEYQKQSQIWNIPWEGRMYNPDNFDGSDAVNQSLSVANTCLYGLVSAVVGALGLAPGLGFIHVGNEKSFIYDIADLYKAEITIPLAFEIAAGGSHSVASRTRRAIRDRFYGSKIVERMVKDIKYLLSFDDYQEDYESPLFIWDGMRDLKPSGTQYDI